MPLTLRRGCSLLVILWMALVGAVGGYCLQVTHFVDEEPVAYPLPHHIPKVEGGVTLRFAMVHDVLHERYAVHGKAYNEERDRRNAPKKRADPGQEYWQAVLQDWLRATRADPQLLHQFDMVGNALASPLESFSKGRPFDSSYVMVHLHQGVQDFVEGRGTHAELHDHREHITRVGAEGRWAQIVATAHTDFVPFDEPTLAIIGMWRDGNASPHHALALAETMLRVGQRYIAWCAYERTVQLANGFPESIREPFTAHCRSRQEKIQEQLSAAEVAKLRPRFEAELKHGQDYQAAYQQYEAARIAAGGDIDDAHFYDDFHAQHGAIASRVGEEDQFVAQNQVAVTRRNVGLAAFCAGLAAFVTACLIVWLSPRRRPA